MSAIEKIMDLHDSAAVARGRVAYVTPHVSGSMGDELQEELVVAKEALLAEVTKLQDELTFYKRRVELFQQWQNKMGDPERTIACDILANGQMLPDTTGKRYEIGSTQSASSFTDIVSDGGMDPRNHAHQVREPLRVQVIYDLAHRKATRYTHTAQPSEVKYGFSETHLVDLVRAIEARDSGD